MIGFLLFNLPLQVLYVNKQNKTQSGISIPAHISFVEYASYRAHLESEPSKSTERSTAQIDSSLSHRIHEDPARFSFRQFSPPSLFPTSYRLPNSTSSCSSGETSNAWLAINCSNFSFWPSISISRHYLFQEARPDFENAIASFILVIMEFLHHSFEGNRVLECEAKSWEGFEHDRVWASC